MAVKRMRWHAAVPRAELAKSLVERPTVDDQDMNPDQDTRKEQFDFEREVLLGEEDD